MRRNLADREQAVGLRQGVAVPRLHFVGVCCYLHTAIVRLHLQDSRLVAARLAGCRAELSAHMLWFFQTRAVWQNRAIINRALINRAIINRKMLLSIN